MTDAVDNGRDVHVGLYYDQSKVDSSSPAVVNLSQHGVVLKHHSGGKINRNVKTKGADWLADYSYTVVVEVDGQSVSEAFFSLC